MHDVPDVSDEMLMAFADDALDGAERAAVLAYLSGHPDARERVAMFALTRNRLIQLLNERLVEPVPERLLATIMGTQADPAAAGQGPARRPARLWDAVAASLGGFFSRASLGLSAASLALGAVAGIVVGTHMSARGTPGEALVALRGGAIVADGALAAALETSAGDKPATFASADGAATWTPVLTFESQDGRFCRQYALSAGSSGQSAALACRAATGHWRIEASLTLSQAGGTALVRPSGRTGEIEDKVAGMIKGDAIVGAAEQGLIARHWQR